MKRILIKISAFTLIISAVGMATAWEVYFDDKVNTVQIVQAEKYLPRSHKITSSDIRLTRVKVENLPDGAVTNLDSVINKEAKVNITKGMLMVDELIGEPELVLDSDQMIVPIPNNWIYAVPGSLRRNDRVFIYAFPSEELSKQVSGTINVDASDDGKHATAAFKASLESAADDSFISEPVLGNITVAFVKDNANNEVKGSSSKLQRFDATGNISQLELNLTQEQFKLLEKTALKDYKLIFSYR